MIRVDSCSRREWFPDSPNAGLDNRVFSRVPPDQIVTSVVTVKVVHPMLRSINREAGESSVARG